MGPEIVNKNKNCVFNGSYAGRDLYITMYQDNEREFVVTRNANIKPVAYFTGREKELDDLRRRIGEKRKSVLVSGMGGIGKTHICRKLFEEYLNKHAEEENGSFRHIGYIEYNGDMDNSLQNCLKFKQQDSPEQNQKAAWKELEYLAAAGKLLLFVDNVDKPTSADPGLQKLKEIPGAIVLTSRQVSFGDEFEPYRIGFLDMEQCKEIYEKIRFEGICRKVDPDEIGDLEYVIEVLAGRHTITVELLAHLARTKIWTVKRLRDELEEKGFRLTFHKVGELVNIQESYEKLYDLSELTEAEQNILEAFSVFPYIPLAAEVCNEWLLADAGVSEDDDILMELYQKGWLQFDMEQESYALHLVFAQFIYEKCKPNIEKHTGLIQACQNCLEIPDSGSALECQKFIPFAENIILKMGMWDGIRLDNFIFTLAYLLQYISEYKKAERLYDIVLWIRKRELGENHPDTALVYNNLAGVYNSQGEYEKAKELYQKSLVIYKRELGEKHPDTALVYNNLAGVYADQGEYKKAERLYEKSLRIRERILGKECPEIAQSYNNLASVYIHQGKYQKAEELCEKSLQIGEKVLGEGHPNTAIIYNNLADVYEEQCKYKKAEELYKKSLRIRKRALGEGDPDTATSYNNLAGVYKSQGEYGKAEGLYKKVLAIIERLLGEGHPDTAVSCNNLAYVYDSQGEYEKAGELYPKSFKTCEKVLGEKHPDIAICCNDLAAVYRGQGEYGKAITYLLKAYKINIFRLGLKHPDTRVVYGNMEITYSEWNPSGNFEQWLEEKMKE